MRTILVAGRGREYLEGEALDHTAPLVFTVADVLTGDECAAIIARAEALGPADAPITTARGFVMRPDIRNNTRVIFDDVELAARLFERVRPALPERVCGMTVKGVNERFRAYRYDKGQRFAPHYDGSFQRNEREESQLTFMIYLNADFDGGRTEFYSFDVDLGVAPRAGMALLFQHHLLHEGCEVRRGVKYVLRSDVMYEQR